VIFSHSNPRAVWDHPRNIRDDQMKACAATGGVIGINGVGVFLADNECSPATMVRHIRYAADLVGVEHVGIGVDSVVDRDEFGKLLERYPRAMKAWPGLTAEDMRSYVFAEPEQLPRLTEALLAEGFSEDETKAIMGGNFLRVAQQVWK
jgi:membrane dipeptidase